MKEYSVYPFKTMNISAAYNSGGSHVAHYRGNPCDYPLDEAGKDKGKDWFFAPFTCVIARVYGVGGRGINTIWLQSVDPVITPIGEIYLTINCRHEDDADIFGFREGMIFQKGKPMFREGEDGKDIGQCFGNHIHFSVAKGRFVPPGWIENSKGAWVTTGEAIRPEQAFFLDPDTKIINTRGLDFNKLPGEDEMITKITTNWFGKDITEDGILKENRNFTAFAAIKKAGMGVSNEGGKAVVFMPDLQVVFNGKEKTIKGSMLGGTVYGGIRDIAEALGAAVDYKDGKVIIDMPPSIKL